MTKYIIGEQAYNSIRYMHPHFWSAYGAQKLGECVKCRYHRDFCCYIRESFPHLVPEDGYCHEFAKQRKGEE